MTMTKTTKTTRPTLTATMLGGEPTLTLYGVSDYRRAAAMIYQAAAALEVESAKERWVIVPNASARRVAIEVINDGDQFRAMKLLNTVAAKLSA